MAAIRITVFYTPDPSNYDENGDIGELEMIESDIEDLENGEITIDEFVEFADDVTYDSMPGVLPSS